VLVVDGALQDAEQIKNDLDGKNVVSLYIGKDPFHSTGKDAYSMQLVESDIRLAVGSFASLDKQVLQKGIHVIHLFDSTHAAAERYIPLSHLYAVLMLIRAFLFLVLLIKLLEEEGLMISLRTCSLIARQQASEQSDGV
jgi:hypothetical protein